MTEVALDTPRDELTVIKPSKEELEIILLIVEQNKLIIESFIKPMLIMKPATED